MRDPFDTGPVLRLGEAKAVAPEPEGTKTGYGPGELTDQQKAGLDEAWKAFGLDEIFSQAMKLRDKAMGEPGAAIKAWRDDIDQRGRKIVSGDDFIQDQIDRLARTAVVPSETVLKSIDPRDDIPLKEFEALLPKATQYGIIPDARPYSFDDVSISVGGMELSPVSDEAIKIEAAPISEEDRKACRSPRFNVSIPTTITVEDFARSINRAIKRSGVVGVTPEQIAALAGNLFHSNFPKIRPLHDLFTAAFAPRIDDGDTSPEALRANHAALVAKKDPQK